jgi:hypothetical protein
MLEVIERDRRKSLLEYVYTHLDIYQANLLEYLFPTEQTTPANGWIDAWRLAYKSNEQEISLLVERIVSKTYFINENDANDTNDTNATASSYVMLLNGRNNNKVQLITSILVPSVLEYLGDHIRDDISDNDILNNCDTFSEWLDACYQSEDEYDDEYDGFDNDFDNLDDFNYFEGYDYEDDEDDYDDYDELG